MPEPIRRASLSAAPVPERRAWPASSSQSHGREAASAVAGLRPPAKRQPPMQALSRRRRYSRPCFPRWPAGAMWPRERPGRAAPRSLFVCGWRAPAKPPPGSRRRSAEQRSPPRAGCAAGAAPAVPYLHAAASPLREYEDCACRPDSRASYPGPLAPHRSAPARRWCRALSAPPCESSTTPHCPP